MTSEKRICYNCGNEREGALLRDPSSEDENKKIWCCNPCYNEWYIK